MNELMYLTIENDELHEIVRKQTLALYQLENVLYRLEDLELIGTHTIDGRQEYHVTEKADPRLAAHRAARGIRKIRGAK